MAYADYSYYKDSYFGKMIEPENFPRYAQKASTFLDYATMGRAKAHPNMEELKMACCVLAEQYQTIEMTQLAAQKGLKASLDTDGPEVASESVGSWSKSYRSGGESATAAANATKNANTALMDTVRMYLGHTGLLSARGYMA